MKIYARNGFVVNVLIMDIDFENVAKNIVNKEVNKTAVMEHVGKIKRNISVVKKRARCIVSTLPLKFLHNQIIIHIIY